MSKKSDDKKKRSSTDTARRIWLAGIGAYGRAFTEAQGAIKDVTGKSSDVFDDLVQKGEMIEMAVDAKRKDIMDKANLSNLNMPDLKMPDLVVPGLNMEERIKKMRARLARMESGEDVATDMSSDLETRLSAIEAKLDRLLAAIEPKKAVTKKTAAKKATKRATTTRTKRTPKPKTKS